MLSPNDTATSPLLIAIYAIAGFVCILFVVLAWMYYSKRKRQNQANTTQLSDVSYDSVPPQSATSRDSIDDLPPTIDMSARSKTPYEVIPTKRPPHSHYEQALPQYADDRSHYKGVDEVPQ